MATYWLTFRIADDAGYAKRYDDLIEAIRQITEGKWWNESSSFVLFASSHDIDRVAAAIKSAFNPDTDLALIGMPDFKSARIVGASKDRDIYDFMPFIKKV